MHCVNMLAILTTILIVSSAYAVQWPAGSYTLVKSKAGCPSGWHEGWRKQDNEDKNNSNEITNGHHFYGTFGSNMEFYYCTKDQQTISGTQGWPSGDYCILRQGISCPPGFQTGSIYWDDEDKNNSNDKDGVLPSGTYDKDTLINYCCRSDGPYSTKILLPTGTPFYLLRFTSSPCQQVKGMVVRQETVKSDDEDNNNKNSNSGSHPLNGGNRNNKLFYCYYY
ncbi:uncharacterized protein LOC127702281 [Mytilus californianus]|uniref:uncharacterized protein LOC127702281 n=1 Tax=Mytilus californianus TaxID=6549 RepID=UPI0022458923|nr:uncharacterized protein LOC127702281 [Mytilus californianus]XP_052062374.1 uncharacterized protein LOC127702281 [Mytilus californianus]XP_052062375.1 uncharacterized protein LOC127702281 [Mytilus californianus]